MNYEVNSHVRAACTALFPERTDVHWETTNHQVWNPREGAAEQCELVYEVSLVYELGMWRRFLHHSAN